MNVLAILATLLFGILLFRAILGYLNDPIIEQDLLKRFTMMKQYESIILRYDALLRLSESTPLYCSTKEGLSTIRKLSDDHLLIHQEFRSMNASLKHLKGTEPKMDRILLRLERYEENSLTFHRDYAQLYDRILSENPNLVG